MVNKKIKNATVCSIDNLKFKSKLEESIYKTLQEHNLNPKYEPITFTLWEGYVPLTPYYDKETNSQRAKRMSQDSNPSRLLVLKDKKVIGIRYTPDFYFKYKDIDIYIEAKGMENDVFYIKKKMFIKYLDNVYIKTKQKSMYFEVYTKKQLLQALQIIKDYEIKSNLLECN